MKLAVELIFNNESQNKINAIRKLLVDNGIHDEAVKFNHISLGDFETETPDILIKVVQDFAKKLEKFDVLLSNVGSFMTGENVLFYSPIITQQFRDIHKNFIDTARRFNLEVGKYYDIDKIIPHCTVAIRLNDEEFFKGFKLLKENNILPLNVTVDKIDVLCFDPKPYKQLAVFELKK